MKVPRSVPAVLPECVKRPACGLFLYEILAYLHWCRCDRGGYGTTCSSHCKLRKLKKCFFFCHLLTFIKKCSIILVVGEPYNIGIFLVSWRSGNRNVSRNGIKYVLF